MPARWPQSTLYLWTIIAIALTSVRCSQTTIADSTSSCKSSKTLGFEAFNPTEKFAMPNGGVVMTFLLNDAATINGFNFQTRIASGGANITVAISPTAKNSALFFNPSPDYSFTKQIDETPGLTPTTVGVEFPIPFEATKLDDDHEWAISFKVNSGNVNVYEGYVPSSNQIEARYGYTQDGSSWNPGGEVGITMGLTLGTPCP